MSREIRGETRRSARQVELTGGALVTDRLDVNALADVVTMPENMISEIWILKMSEIHAWLGMTPDEDCQYNAARTGKKNVHW